MPPGFLCQEYASKKIAVKMKLVHRTIEKYREKRMG